MEDEKTNMKKMLTTVDAIDPSSIGLLSAVYRVV